MGIKISEYIIIFLGVLMLLIALIVSILINKANNGSSPSSPSVLEGCKVLQYNGQEKINVLYFSDKESAQKYTDFFLSSNPFNENKEAFNFYYIDDYEASCEIYKGIAVLCHSKELIKKAASCPNDFIVVLEDENERIRSSAYLNVMSLNVRHFFTVFLHEFGHVFANLAEEYVPAKLPPSQPNCKQKCENFQEEIDGCFAGCSENTYHRSVAEGIMRTLSPENKEVPYGIFNTNIIRKIITESLDKKSSSIPLTGKALQDFQNTCAKQNYILSEIKPDGKIINTIQKGCRTGTLGEGAYNYEIKDKEDNTIFSDNFNAYFFSSAPKDKGGELAGEVQSYDEASLTITLTLPILTEAEELKVLDPEGSTIAESDFNKIGFRPCLRK